MAIEVSFFNTSVFKIARPIRGSIAEFHQFESLVKDIVREALVHAQALTLVTWDPGKHSVAHDFGEGQYWTSGNRKKYFINRVDVVDENTYNNLFDAEDFERGLLKIVIDPDPNIMFEELAYHVFEDTSHFTVYEMLYCDEDFYGLNWINPKIDVQTLLSKFNL